MQTYIATSFITGCVLGHFFHHVQTEQKDSENINFSIPKNSMNKIDSNTIKFINSTILQHGVPSKLSFDVDGNPTFTYQTKSISTRNSDGVIECYLTQGGNSKYYKL